VRADDEARAGRDDGHERRARVSHERQAAEIGRRGVSSAGQHQRGQAGPGQHQRGDAEVFLALKQRADHGRGGQVRAHDGPVERDDAFHLEFGRGGEVRVISVSVLGTVADALCRPSRAGVTGRVCDRSWESQARVAVDRDGTMNKIGDNDEEWVIEMAVPLAALGFADAHTGTQIPFSIHCCEIGHGSSRGCGGWGVEQPGELALGP
jgi:hypothetical protein